MRNLPQNLFSLALLLLAACASREASPTAGEKQELEKWAALLRSQEPDDMHEAAFALARIGPPALPTLKAALGEGSSPLRYAAARSLWAMGHAGGGAAPELSLALDDSDSRVRAAAAEALMSVGTAPKEGVAALTRHLSDRNWFVRFQCARALGRLGAPAFRSLHALARAEHKDRNDEVREAAARSHATLQRLYRRLLQQGVRRGRGR